MLTIEVVGCQPVLAVHNTVKVADIALCQKSIMRLNLRPQSRYYDIDFSDMHKAIVVGVHVVTDLFAVSFRYGREVVISVKFVVTQTDNHLFVMVACPIPKFVLGIGVVFGVRQIKVSRVAGNR